MRRFMAIMFAACVGTAISNSVGMADQPLKIPAPTIVPTEPVKTLPPATPAMASTASTGCTDCAAGTAPMARPAAGVKPMHSGPFVSLLREKIAVHRREPDGCPTPFGCGNPWTEFKFAFGSCRQFFGTAEASQGQLRRTTLRD